MIISVLSLLAIGEALILIVVWVTSRSTRYDGTIRIRMNNGVQTHQLIVNGDVYDIAKMKKIRFKVDSDFHSQHTVPDPPPPPKK